MKCYKSECNDSKLIFKKDFILVEIKKEKFKIICKHLVCPNCQETYMTNEQMDKLLDVLKEEHKKECKRRI
jgi:hypothetical protein